MKDKHGFYNPPSDDHPTGSEYDAEHERIEREVTREQLFEFLDCHPSSYDPDVAEHLTNAKRAFNDRDDRYLAHCIIAACRLAGREVTNERTDKWANDYANRNKETKEKHVPADLMDTIEDIALRK